MYNIKTINNISPVGLDKLKQLGYNVSADIDDPEGIIVRSADMHGYNTLRFSASQEPERAITTSRSRSLPKRA